VTIFFFFSSFFRYILKKKSVATLWKRQNGTEWAETRCFFRCLAFQRRQFNKKKLEVATDALVLQYCARTEQNPSEFDGKMTLRDLDRAEQVFAIRVLVYKLLPPNNGSTTATTAVLIRNSQSASEEVLNLDLYSCHFSLILNVEIYASRYMCSTLNCRRTFSFRRGINPSIADSRKTRSPVRREGGKNKSLFPSAQALLRLLCSH